MYHRVNRRRLPVCAKTPIDTWSGANGRVKGGVREGNHCSARHRLTCRRLRVREMQCLWPRCPVEPCSPCLDPDMEDARARFWVDIPPAGRPTSPTLLSFPGLRRHPGGDVRALSCAISAASGYAIRAWGRFGGVETQEWMKRGENKSRLVAVELFYRRLASTISVRGQGEAVARRGESGVFGGDGRQVRGGGFAGVDARCLTAHTAQTVHLADCIGQGLYCVGSPLPLARVGTD